jgi:hypothetical protein
MPQLAPLNRVPFGKFNRASAFPVATRLELVDKSCCRELQLLIKPTTENEEKIVDIQTIV